MASRKKSTPSILSVATDEYKETLIKQLNKLNADRNVKDAVSSLTAYVKHNKLRGVRVPARGFGEGTTSFGNLAHLALSGFPVSEEDTSRLDAWLMSRKVEASHEDADGAVVSKVVDVQSAIRLKASEFIGENLEAVIDDGDFAFDLGRVLKGAELGAPILRIVGEFVESKRVYFESVAKENDKEIKAAHKHLNVKKIVSMLERWSNDVALALAQKKANRKPTVRKPKTATQQTAKLSVLKEYTTTPGNTLVGLPATSMIGASQAWIYNTKNKKLIVLRSEDRLGLQCRGMAIQNYDVLTSEMRTLRKPDETIKEMLKAGKVNLRKLMDNLSTKKQEANPRISKDHIILRVL